MIAYAHEMISTHLSTLWHVRDIDTWFRLLSNMSATKGHTYPAMFFSQNTGGRVDATMSGTTPIEADTMGVHKSTLCNSQLQKNRLPPHPHARLSLPF